MPGEPSPAPVDSSGHLFVSGGDHVVVDIQSSESGYRNQLFWSSDNWATLHYLGIDNEVASIDLGTFAPGTRIDFGLVNDPGNLIVTGSAADNFDNFEHARVSPQQGGVQIGFEDLAGGGDQDFNDAIISVRGVTTTAPEVTDPAQGARGPARRATPAIPATPATPATRATPADRAQPADRGQPATPAPHANATRATPATPATPSARSAASRILTDAAASLVASAKSAAPARSRAAVSTVVKAPQRR